MRRALWGPRCALSGVVDQPMQSIGIGRGFLRRRCISLKGMKPLRPPRTDSKIVWRVVERLSRKQTKACGLVCLIRDRGAASPGFTCGGVEYIPLGRNVCGLADVVLAHCKRLGTPTPHDLA